MSLPHDGGVLGLWGLWGLWYAGVVIAVYTSGLGVLALLALAVHGRRSGADARVIAFGGWLPRALLYVAWSAPWVVLGFVWQITFHLARHAWAMGRVLAHRELTRVLGTEE